MTPEQRDALIRRLYPDRRLLLRDIAAQLGVTEATVRHRARALGLPNRGPRRNEARRDQCLHLWEQGLRARTIARRLGMSVSGVRWYLGEAGLIPRATSALRTRGAAFSKWRCPEGHLNVITDWRAVQPCPHCGATIPALAA